MKLIIAGSRTITLTVDTLKEVLVTGFKLTGAEEIVCGEANGIDTSGKWLAERQGIPLVSFPADWDTHGKSAGPIRNKQMADYADALLLIWDGESKGSANMKENMLKLNKPVYEVILRKHNV